MAARLYGGFGVALYAAFFFVIVRGIVSFIVDDVFGQAHSVFPLYLGSAVIIELLALTRLKDKPLAFGAVGGLLIGTLGTVIEKLWNDLVFPFPWPRDIWFEGLAMAIPVAVGTGLCGALFFLGLTGRLPAPGVRRAVVAGAILVTTVAVANGLSATVPKDASATISTTQVGTESAPEIMTKIAVQPADLVDDHPTWVQLTAWQGGSKYVKGIVTQRLKRTGPNTWESTRPMPVGGNWKTLVRVQDGRMLTAAPIFLPADQPFDVKEVPVEAEGHPRLRPGDQDPAARAVVRRSHLAVGRRERHRAAVQPGHPRRHLRCRQPGLASHRGARRCARRLRPADVERHIYADVMMLAGALYAHHAALLAIPALVPAVVVVGVVLHIARKDRRDEREERDIIERAFEDSPSDADHDQEKDT